jgi:tellurite resistance protein TerC
MMTPLVIVIAAIGVANVVFALDSIPAIFGLTADPYIIITANAFALMGLRQLYFLIGGLLDRLIFLNIGLSVILAFIGVKLLIVTSLGFIVVVLALTVVASLGKQRRDLRRSE